jgi:nucleoside-diphosphate-sugar epimerase
VAARIVITGATGLIGSHLLASWTQNDGVAVPVGGGDDLLGPGAARRIVARLAPDVVVHLAWNASGTAGYRTDRRNPAWVAATVELAEACADSGTWFIGTGTAVDDVLDATDAYTKAKAQLRVELAARIDAGTCSWVRPFYVFDPHRGRPALVADALRARNSGARLLLRTPSSRHDFVHAEDVAAAIRTVVRHRLAGEVPVGSGQLRQVSDLVAALGVVWNPPPGTPPPEPIPSSPSQRHEAADIRRLRDHGWTPQKTRELFQSA